MVDKEMVILVPTERAANEVVMALMKLDEEGSIELYSSTIILKAADGSVSVKDDRHLHGTRGTGPGLSSGALIGLLAGPVGAAVGAAISRAAGLGGDGADLSIAEYFMQHITTGLRQGGHVVCASVWEDCPLIVDAAVAPFGAHVLRPATGAIAVAKIKAEMQKLDEEQRLLESERARATGAAKARLEAKLRQLHAKQATHRERLRKRASILQERWDAKVACTKRKATAANAEARARREQHIETLERLVEAQKELFRELFA